MKEQTKDGIKIVAMLAFLVGLPAVLLASGDMLGVAACVAGAALGFGTALLGAKHK